MPGSKIRFDQTSSIVILGAHPDDAVRACGGVMLRALSAGAKVTVIAVTDGAALFGKEGIPDGRRTAAGRKAEQVKALRRIGLPKRSTFFLGFPDGGLAKLRHRHRTERLGAYFCPWLHADRTNKTSCVPEIVFTTNNLVKLLKRILSDASPTHVFTHHHCDKHPDHRGVTWFIRKALAELTCDDASSVPPMVYEYLTYLPGKHWPPAGAAVPVKAARALGFSGRVVNHRLTHDEIAAKDRALDCFTPILGDAYIDNWRRSNEITWIEE